MDAQTAREFFAPQKRTGRNVEHTSFWMNPMNVEFIRAASKRCRMPQGTILETIINFYRLTRKREILAAQGKQLSAYDQDRMRDVEYLLRVIPY